MLHENGTAQLKNSSLIADQEASGSYITVIGEENTTLLTPCNFVYKANTALQDAAYCQCV